MMRIDAKVDQAGEKLAIAEDAKARGDDELASGGLMSISVRC